MNIACMSLLSHCMWVSHAAMFQCVFNCEVAEIYKPQMMFIINTKANVDVKVRS